MRIDKSRQNNFSGAVDLANSLPVPLDPGIAQRVSGRTDRDNFASVAKDGAVRDDAEALQVSPSSRLIATGGRAKSQQLPRV